MTAAANGTADDGSAPWPEGMAPSAINDSARGMMAIVRRWGTDISGAIVTTGSSTAYAVTSHSTYDSLAHLDGQMIAFTPHTTCGATVTLNVDGLGAKPLRSAPGVELPSGAVIQGTPYVVTYSNAEGAFYLHGFVSSPLQHSGRGEVRFLGLHGSKQLFRVGLWSSDLANRVCCSFPVVWDNVRLRRRDDHVQYPRSPRARHCRQVRYGWLCRFTRCHVDHERRRPWRDKNA